MGINQRDMSKMFNTDELRKNGYVRYPRIFLDMLIRDYCKDKQDPVQTGIMMYLYSKVAYSPYQYTWRNDKYNVKVGQCIVKITELAAILGCTVYGVRKGLEELERNNVITRHRLRNGVAIEIIDYQSFIQNKLSYGK